MVDNIHTAPVTVFTKVTGAIEHHDLSTALHAAYEDATQSGGRVYPCTIAFQGGRMMLSLTLPFGFVAKHVIVDAATKGKSPAKNRNRPLIDGHVKTIKRYLLDNPDSYFIGAISMNVQTVPQVHVMTTNATIRAGYVVIDDSTFFYVTDGQHRVKAIGEALEENPLFSKDSVTVQINVEPSIERIHQDFADAAQTKQIPPSLLAAYNMREPLNRVLNGIVKQSPLFNDRIDETSKTLGKYSQSVFLLNQVRGFLKAFMFGDYAMSDEQLSRETAKRLARKDQQDRVIMHVLQLLEALTETMEPWDQIVKLEAHSEAGSGIPSLRAAYLNLTATGLVLIGNIGHEINGKGFDDATRIEKYRELGALIDWRRSADFWNGTVLMPDTKKTGATKVLTARGPVNKATRKISEALGLTKAQPESPQPQVEVLEVNGEPARVLAAAP